MALAEMKCKLMLLLWLACQCIRSTTTTSEQGPCNLAECSPIIQGRMCASGATVGCCPASCSFNEIGTERAIYDILHIVPITQPIEGTCSASFTTNTLQDYFRVHTSPVDSTCAVQGICEMQNNCFNAQTQQKHIFINEEYATIVQTMTSSPSLSTSLITYPPSTQQASTHLSIHNPSPTNSPSAAQSMLIAKPLVSTIFSCAISSTSSVSSSTSSVSSSTSSVSSSGTNQQLYTIVAVVVAAGLICAVVGVFTVVCLTFLLMRGRRMPEKSRVVESHDNEYAEISQEIQHTPAEGQYSEIAQATKNVHTYSVLEDPSARHLHTPTPAYETISITQARPDTGHAHMAKPVSSNPQVKEPVYSNPQAKEPVYSNPQVKEPVYSNPQAKEPAYSNPQVKEPVSSNPQVNEPAYSNPQMKEPAYSNPQVKEPAYSNPQVKEPTYSNPQVKEPTYSNPQVKEPVYSNPQMKEPAYSNPQVKEPTDYNPYVGSSGSKQTQPAVYSTVVRQGGKKVTITILPKKNTDQLLHDSSSNDNNPAISIPECHNVSEQDSKDVTLSTASSNQAKPNTANPGVQSILRNREYSTVIRQEGKKVTAILIPQQLDLDLPFQQETESARTPSTMNMLEDTDNREHPMYSTVVRQNGKKVSVRVQAQSNADGNNQ